MPDIQENITLEEFQKRKIKFQSEEFIYCINNPFFYLRWENIFKPRKFKEKLKMFLDRFKFWEKCGTGGKNILFLGRRNKSIDSKELIIESLKSEINFSKENKVIVLGKGDYEVDEEFSRNLPKNVRFIFANNINTINPAFKYLPIGRDFRSRLFFSDVLPEYDKERLCYCNYSVNTHPQRKYLYEQIKNKDFIDFEHMGNFLNYSMGRKEFFEKISKSKFVICPRGRAFDTFRLWDSLYLGAVPIVVKEAVFHEYLQDLPILFLDSYEQFSELTEELLNNYYEKMLKTKYNYSKLRFSYWIDQIESSIAA